MGQPEAVQVLLWARWEDATVSTSLASGFATSPIPHVSGDNRGGSFLLVTMNIFFNMKGTALWREDKS